jgi:hypothetical protein
MPAPPECDAILPAVGAQEGRPGWRRNFAVLWLAQLVAMAGFSSAIPFIPLYVQELGVADRDAVVVWAGALSSVAAISTAFMARYYEGEGRTRLRGAALAVLVAELRALPDGLASRVRADLLLADVLRALRWPEDAIAAQGDRAGAAWRSPGRARPAPAWPAWRATDRCAGAALVRPARSAHRARTSTRRRPGPWGRPSAAAARATASRSRAPAPWVAGAAA